NPTFVNVYCFLVGNDYRDPRVSAISACLEREMCRLLAIKGRTDGKNTEHFPGKNMSIGTRLENGANGGHLFVLGAERMIEFEGVPVSWGDYFRALRCNPLVSRKRHVL